jgi:hypothetical protein
MIGDLPGGGSVTARVANCLPLGNDGNSFLIGAALYTHGNVWKIANPPEDWDVVAQSAPAPGAMKASADNSAQLTVNKKVWPYNLFSDGVEAHPKRK